MKTRLLFVAAVLVLGAIAGAQTQAPGANVVVIHGGWIFDSVRDDVRRNAGIVVRDGTIVEVDADLTGRAIPAARFVRLDDDEYLLPGLIRLNGVGLSNFRSGAPYAVERSLVFGDERVHNP